MKERGSESKGTTSYPHLRTVVPLLLDHVPVRPVRRETDGVGRPTQVAVDRGRDRETRPVPRPSAATPTDPQPFVGPVYPRTGSGSERGKRGGGCRGVAGAPRTCNSYRARAPRGTGGDGGPSYRTGVPRNEKETEKRGGDPRPPPPHRHCRRRPPPRGGRWRTGHRTRTSLVRSAH